MRPLEVPAHPILKVNAMQTIDAEVIPNSSVMTCPATDIDTGTANYEAVRFNAMKHGILSRLVVLAHEDHAEFADLLAALIDEHRPAGMTERHLIEELATIIWRKRRVLLAEGAKINEGLKSAANSSKTVMSSAAPFQRGMASENTDVRDLLDLTPEDIAESQKSAALDLAATKRAAAILRKGDLYVVIAETNNETENPLWHGEVHALKRFYELPRDARPATKDCIHYSAPSSRRARYSAATASPAS